MYKDKIKTFQKLTRILELINQVQSYNLRNSKHVKDEDSDLGTSFSLTLYYKERIEINKLIIVRLKKYYNNTLNKLETFKLIKLIKMNKKTYLIEIETSISSNELIFELQENLHHLEGANISILTNN